jgi:hypothetical protein
MVSCRALVNECGNLGAGLVKLCAAEVNSSNFRFPICSWVKALAE